MQVVFLTTIPSPYRVAFFNEWGKLCDLTVIFERKSSADRDDTWKNVDARNFKPIYLQGINIKANKAFCPSVIKTIKELTFDVFIVGGYNTPTAMLAAQYLRRKHIPYILNADGGYVKKDSPIVEKAKRHFISSAAMWICTSERTKEYFTHYGAEPELIRKYPFTSLYRENILNKPVSDDEKEKIRQRFGISEDKMVMSVGQFIHRKGFDVLLRAKRKLPENTGLYIIGGTETEEYKSIVEEFHLQNVHFLPFMKPVELAEYYKSADVFAFPTREDIWGLVINEAAAYGLPIVTTYNCIAGLEMIENSKNGFIVLTGDEDTLAEKIRKLLENKMLAHSFSKEIIDVAGKYTYEEMARVHMSIVEEFVNLHERNKRQEMG